MLVQFAQMGAAYVCARFGTESPSVGLLSIGEEPTKGTPLVKETHGLLAGSAGGGAGSAGFEFVGNLEGRDLLPSPADVIVTDGFTGNVTLKTLEGSLRFLFDTMLGVFGTDDATREASQVLLPHLLPLAAQFEPENTGGAMLLGIDGVCVISHGSSNATAMMNACSWPTSAPPGASPTRWRLRCVPPIRRKRPGQTAQTGGYGRRSPTLVPCPQRPTSTGPPRPQGVFELIRDQLADILETDPSSITEAPRSPRTSNADSLALIELVEALEEELGERTVGFRIDDEDLEDLRTVRDAVDYVVAKLGGSRRAGVPSGAGARPGAADGLADRLGHRFADPSLLHQALSHRSWCAEQEGGRRPTSGSSSWATPCSGLVVAEHCYDRYPDFPEGQLAKVRSAVVNARVLAEVAAEPRCRRGPPARAGARRPRAAAPRSRILADATEAVIGAVYLDAGWAAAERLVLRAAGRPHRARRPTSPTTSTTRAGCRRRPCARRGRARLRGRGLGARPRPRATGPRCIVAGDRAGHGRGDAPRRTPSRRPAADDAGEESADA